MDWDILSKSNTKALLLVAHPDDETVFCGGTMLYYPKCQWKIVCMTEGGGNAPRPEFEEAIKRFKDLGVNIIEPHLWLGQRKFEKQKDKSEEENNALRNAIKSEWITVLKQQDLSSDVVFTHSEAGEYDKEDHKLLNEVAKNLCSNIWEFICPGASNCSQSYKKEIKVIPLTGGILKQKTDVFNYSYTSQLYNWRGDLNRVFWYEFRTGPEIFTSD